METISKAAEVFDLAIKHKKVRFWHPILSQCLIFWQVNIEMLSLWCRILNEQQRYPDAVSTLALADSLSVPVGTPFYMMTC